MYVSKAAKCKVGQSDGNIACIKYISLDAGCKFKSCVVHRMLVKHAYTNCTQREIYTVNVRAHIHIHRIHTCMYVNTWASQALNNVDQKCLLALYLI